MQNIELKVRHPDLARARTAADALGATYTWTRLQRDTYFAAPGSSGRRRGKPDARVKLREMPGQAEIIIYRRADGTTPRPSTYSLTPVRDPGAALALLGDAWPSAGIVEKVRELWLWENVRIHLDDVKHLGTFVELEGVIGPNVDAALSRTRVDHVITALDLSSCTPIPQSYRDLVSAL